MLTIYNAATRNFSLAAAVVMVIGAMLSDASAAEQDLYDYTVSITSSSNVGPREIGQVVHLTQASAITRLTISVGTVGAPATDDLIIRFYSTTSDNINSAEPAGLLWSGVYPGTTFPTGSPLISSEIPTVLVPEWFVWTIATAHEDILLNTRWGSEGLGNFGIHGRKFQRNTPSTWLGLGFTGPLAVRLDGFPVPEPDAVAILAIAALAPISARRRKSVPRNRS